MTRNDHIAPLGAISANHLSKWDTVSYYPIGGELHDLLVERLFSDCLWHPVFGHRAILEYKRFMFLVSVADYALVPSKVVDLVWHEHLLFSKDYWEVFCGQLLQKTIHHLPSKEEPNEASQESYDKTLKLYQSIFQKEPPTDIW